MVSLTQGPTGSLLAKNLTRLRIERRLNFAELSRATEAAGNYIPVIGLRRIEDEGRRVSVDDLLTFAAVYEVAIADLLLPETEESGDFGVTGFAEPMSRITAQRLLGLRGRKDGPHHHVFTLADVELVAEVDGTVVAQGETAMVEALMQLIRQQVIEQMRGEKMSGGEA